MSQLVCMGAMVMCDQGTVPVPLVVIPEGSLVTTGTPVATIMDFAPIVNIATFTLCHSPANPATKNPLTPGVAPCVPATAAPWAPGAPAVLVNGIPALTNDSVCACMLGGVIQVMEPGQFIVEVAG